MAGMELDGLEEFKQATRDMTDDVDADDQTRTVGTHVPYAPPVEYGTAPHVITGDPLAFPGDNGETVFTTRVQHPGTDPQPHVRPGMRATKQQLAAIAVAADSLEEFLDNAALAAVVEIKQRTPVKTGNLRGSYRVL